MNRFMHRHEKPSHARADDGTPLEVKEGIVIDQEGTPIWTGDAQANSTSPNVKIVQFNWPLGLMIFVGIPILMMAGIAVFSIILAILLITFVLKTLLRTFR